MLILVSTKNKALVLYRKKFCLAYISGTFVQCIFPATKKTHWHTTSCCESKRKDWRACAAII